MPSRNPSSLTLCAASHPASAGAGSFRTDGNAAPRRACAGRRPWGPRLLALAVLALLAGDVSAGVFVYEGRLDDLGQPANGRYDFQLTPFAGDAVKQSMTAPLNFYGVEVRDGRFRIDFDTPVALGSDVWLELAVRDGGASAFSAIPGRSKAIAAPLIGACWSTTGDSGSDPASNFLGTTDAQPLELRARNARGMRIEASSATAGSPALPITSNTLLGSRGNLTEPFVRGAAIGGGGLPVGVTDPDVSEAAGPNRIEGHYGVVAGGAGNRAGSTAGGLGISAGASVGGGFGNMANGGRSVVGGGSGNTAFGPNTTVAGGLDNLADQTGSVVSGGEANYAGGDGTHAVVSGGRQNMALGLASVVAGGQFNTALGGNAAIAGGRNNCVGAAAGYAAGTRAKVRSGSAYVPLAGNCVGVPLNGVIGDVGTFVWADSTEEDFVSTGADQFAVRAGGGFGLNVAPPVATVEMTVQSSKNGSDFSNIWLKQRGQADGILFSAGGGNGSNNAGFFVDHYNGTNQARRMELAADGSVFIRSNVTAANTGVTMAAGGGSFTSLSDRRVKTAIEAIDGLAILERVVDLPISTWSYIAQGTGIRHIGPMAQDFKAAFEVGETDTGITTIDADGVALAAIQGLNAKLEAERDALAGEVQRLGAENAALRGEAEDIRERLARLEAHLTADGAR
ncbi:MAG: tail fiber domain-containing protein [Lysobacterales bacterium]